MSAAAGLPALDRRRPSPCPDAVEDERDDTLGLRFGLLAWLLQHAPNVLLIPGTAGADHLEANTAVGEITFDKATRATLDAVESRSSEVPIG